VYIYSFIEDSKSRKHANFGYAAKIRFATSIINGVESIWVTAKPQCAVAFIEVLQRGVESLFGKK
jgi:hypothetical protein